MPFTFSCTACDPRPTWPVLEQFLEHARDTHEGRDPGQLLVTGFTSQVEAQRHEPAPDDYDDPTGAARPAHRHASRPKLHAHPGGDSPHWHDWSTEDTTCT